MANAESVPLKSIRRRKKTEPAAIILGILKYAFFVLVAVVILYPIINMVAYSFNDKYDALRRGIYLLPRMWSVNSYKDLLDPYRGFTVGLKTTALRTIIGTVSSLGATALLSFILSRKRFLFKSWLSFFWIFAMYASAGLIPTYILCRKLYLYNSFWVYIIPNLVSIANIFVIRSYMKGIPDSLEEAAQLEGADYMKVFWSIISPLCKPVYAATGLFIAVYHWNSWFDAMLYNRFDPQYTLAQYELMKYLNSMMWYNGTGCNSPTSYSTVCAAALLTLIPVAIAYPFFQKYFITGINVKSLKD